MGPRRVRGTKVAVGMVLTFLGVTISGCIDADELDVQEAVEPYTRISGWSGGEGGGTSCFVVSSVPPRWCMDLDLRFTDFRCDPPQLLFALFDGWAVSQQEFLQVLDAGQHPALERSPAGAYVHCEYAVEWTVTARSLPPGSRLHVVASHDGQEETGTCEIAFNDECAAGGRAEGAFTFHGANEEVELLALVKAEIETAVPREPLGVPGGKASKDIRLTLRS